MMKTTFESAEELRNSLKSQVREMFAEIPDEMLMPMWHKFSAEKRISMLDRRGQNGGRPSDSRKSEIRSKIENTESLSLESPYGKRANGPEIFRLILAHYGLEFVKLIAEAHGANLGSGVFVGFGSDKFWLSFIGIKSITIGENRHGKPTVVVTYDNKRELAKAAKKPAAE